ncbi:hypothetical protein C8J56DRAFT_906344 [Mycena floridula]|nr:hypothetical protein C8J56DRAFT_906344 [Mycena floridula]
MPCKGYLSLALFLLHLSSLSSHFISRLEPKQPEKQNSPNPLQNAFPILICRLSILYRLIQPLSSSGISNSEVVLGGLYNVQLPRRPVEPTGKPGEEREMAALLRSLWAGSLDERSGKKGHGQLGNQGTDLEEKRVSKEVGFSFVV